MSEKYAVMSPVALRVPVGPAAVFTPRADTVVPNDPPLPAGP